MANLTFASATLNVSRTAILLTIGSTTIVTDPLQLSGGAHVTGLSATVDGVAATLGTVNLPASGNVITVPVTSTINAGQMVVFTATGSNLEDSAGSPLLLTNQSITVTPYQNSLQSSLASLFAGDTLIAQLQAGTFGNVYNVGQNEFVVYDVNNQFPLIFFQATLVGNNNQGGTGFGKLLGWQKASGSYLAPGSKIAWTGSLVAALFTADPLIAYLQVGNFGPLISGGSGNWTLYAVDGTTPVITFNATVNGAGLFSSYSGYQQVTGTSFAPASGVQVVPGAAGVVASTGSFSNVQLTSASYVPTKYLRVTCPLNNTGIVLINNSSAFLQAGVRIAPGQSANIPLGSGTNMTAFYANFTAAADYANFVAL